MIVAVSARWLIAPVVGDGIPFATMFGATAFAVWYGGRRVASLVAIAGYLACDLLFIRPHGSLAALATGAGFVSFLAYIASCVVIIALGRGMQVAKRRAEMGEQELFTANRIATRRADELQALFDAAPIAVWVAHDPDCQMVTGNRFAAGLIGNTREWAALQDARLDAEPGMYLRQRGDVVSPARHPLQRAAHGESVSSEEYELAIDGSDSVFLSCSAVPLLDERGSIRGAMAVATDVTEEKRSSAAAHEAEQLLRLITDQMPVLISYIDSTFRYRMVNRAYETWFQQRQEQMLGKTTLEVLGDVAWSRLEPYMTRAMAGETVSFEDEVEYKYAGRRWIHALYVPHLNADGSTAGLAVLVTDLTERHRIEEAVRRSESAQRLLVAMHDATRDLHDPSTALDRMLERIGAFFRVSRVAYGDVDAAVSTVTIGRDYTVGVPSIVGQHPLDDFSHALTAELRDARSVAVRDVLTDARVADAVASYTALDARALLCVPLVKDTRLVSLLVITDTGVREWTNDEVWLLEQVAERVWATMENARADMALRESRDVLSMAMRSGGMGAWSRDMQTNRVWWSRELEELFGLPPGGFEGSNDGFFAFVHPDDRAAVAAAVDRAMIRDEDYAIEFRFLHASGEWRWMEGRGRGVRSSEDGRVMLYGLGIDITERRRVDEALKEADRQKDEFLATLAHELRNPLAPIRNASQYLRLRDRDDPDVRSAREIIERQVHHLVRLVDDLLDVSRISRGKIALQRERVALAVIVGNAVEASRPVVDSLGHTLLVALPPAPVMLDADFTRISQVLTNLLNNAAKYTPPGGRIELSAEIDGHEAVVRVRDNGIGIPRDMLPRIFRMFTQVDQSLERSAGGLGIGLTLVDRLVQLHGGRVEARSEGAGAGSEFIVTLPLHADPAAPGASVELAASLPTSSRILVVDDNVDSADSLAMMLRHLGHEVHIAYDGLAGIEAAARVRPEILLLDIGLPLRNGYEVARQVRQEVWGGAMLIVAISGWGQDEDRRRSNEAGFDHHLVKPVDHRVLLALLADRFGAHVTERVSPPIGTETD